MSFISNLTNLFKEYLVVVVVVNQVACQELRNSRLLEPVERQHFILSFKKSSILKGLVLHRLQKNRIAAYLVWAPMMRKLKIYKQLGLKVVSNLGDELQNVRKAEASLMQIN
jgi:hypothetical protein